MVEGHQCHRVAHAHRKLLMGKRFTAESPNKRFADGASALDGKPLTRIEVHGKNLFYFFGEGEELVVMHVHFGMSGAFKTLSLPGPEPRETTRLILTNKPMGLTLHLSAMTVAHGGMDLYEARKAKLGPDPLREDADVEKVWTRVQGSRKPIGQLLMDQDAVAGLGNIYRAEVLFKAGVHPEQPGNTMDRAAFDRVWRHSVLLLQRGFQTGSILTVDADEARKLGKPWTRRYVYNHKVCGRCGSFIRTWDMNARTVYACETCQPLDHGTVVTAERAKAMAAAGPTKVFQSHCAPEAADNQAPGQMTVLVLKRALSAKSLPTAGRKQELVARLEAAIGVIPSAKPPEEVVTELVTDGPTEDLSKLTVPRLQQRLAGLGLPQSGRKAALILRLQTRGPGAGAQPSTASRDTPDDQGEEWEDIGQPPGSHPSAPDASEAGAGAAAQPDAAGPSGVASDAAKPAAVRRSKNVGPVAQGMEVNIEAGAAAELAAEGIDLEQAEPAPPMPPDVRPGTGALNDVMSAEAAALEKNAAGEGRNVEHVALENDQTVADASAKSRRGRSGKSTGQLDGTFPKRKRSRLSSGPSRKTGQ
ncbi:hypothetical protein WJX74_010237 [Apatococcus lobatus]|uniref:DNA-(apurinic or apyrimidinic site) lyase n=1 Tax=Apatococcus lobatus TaxID=904363 RepID=A0AAW1SHN7_9CHLO